MDIPRLILKNRSAFRCQPDFERFRRAVTTNEPGPVPVGDLFADPETIGAYLGERVFDYAGMSADPDHRVTPAIFWSAYRFIHQTIRYCADHGWDFAPCFSMIPFPGFTFDLLDNTAPLAAGRKRSWQNDHRGPLASWDDLERYRWPQDVGAINRMSRVMARSAPDGMRVMVLPGSVFEWTGKLMGLESFCVALAEQPALVDAVIERVAAVIEAVVADIIGEANVGGIFITDDLGYATGTLISPRALREKFIPPTKRLIDLIHSAGKLAIFHSCGNMYAVMDDLIAAGIDGKHSFEDKILPVEAAYRRWSDRVGLIGGVDMHLLASGDEAAVRRRTRAILDICGPGGRYVLGTGNSVANYIPPENYRAMLDEGQRWNREHFGLIPAHSARICMP